MYRNYDPEAGPPLYTGSIPPLMPRVPKGSKSRQQVQPPKLRGGARPARMDQSPSDTISVRRRWSDARDDGMIAHARRSSSLDQASPPSAVAQMYNIGSVKKENIAPEFNSMFALTDSRWAPAKYEIVGENETMDMWTVQGMMALLKHASGIYITVLFHMVVTVCVLVGLRLAEKALDENIFRDIVDETVVNLVTGIVAFALVFRINLAYARWWDSRRSCEDFAAKFFIACMLSYSFDQFTLATARSKAAFRLRMAGVCSLLHAEALKELGSMVELPCLGSRVLNQKQVQMTLGGPAGAFDQHGRLPKGLQGRYSSESVAHNVPATRNGVAQGYIWTVMLISGRFNQHMLASPIIARLYALLDDGVASYFDALVVRTTPFPFPFMQIINFGLFLIKIIVPVVVHQTGVPLIWAIPLTCCCVFGFFGIGRVAEELEQPFGSDFYDHPLENWQIDFDLCLLDLVENQSFEVPRVDLVPQMAPSLDGIKAEVEEKPDLTNEAKEVLKLDWTQLVHPALASEYTKELDQRVPHSMREVSKDHVHTSPLAEVAAPSPNVKPLMAQNQNNLRSSFTTFSGIPGDLGGVPAWQAQFDVVAGLGPEAVEEDTIADTESEHGGRPVLPGQTTQFNQIMPNGRR
ncbi:unnamed protein product [Amoebophrya sp. A120]|nr:unnamed protein product [Amoebophrya sp. A120]|eukprot:GSA120T00016577001.1